MDISKVIDIRFFNWNTLKRTTACFLRQLRHFQQKKEELIRGFLTTKELKQAEIHWIASVQFNFLADWLNFENLRGDQTGIEFAGPFPIRASSGQQESKAYICLFTCTSSRAIHLELVEDLSTANFILAFSSFISHHFQTKMVLCDNATTFILWEAIPPIGYFLASTTDPLILLDTLAKGLLDQLSWETYRLQQAIQVSNQGRRRSPRP
jgi:hypothetical protein